MGDVDVDVDVDLLIAPPVRSLEACAVHLYGQMSWKFLCNVQKKGTELPTIGGAFIGSRNGVPSRKGCVFNGRMTRASDKSVRPPPNPTPSTPPPLTSPLTPTPTLPRWPSLRILNR